MKIECNICKKYIELEYYNLHFEKCSSAKYIHDKMKKLYNKDVSISELSKLSETEFQKKYFWVLNRTYETTTNKIEKKLLENVLYGQGRELPF